MDIFKRKRSACIPFPVDIFVNRFRIDTNPVVGNATAHFSFPPVDQYPDMPFPQFGLNSVHDRIFDKRLDDQFDDPAWK